MVAFQEAASWNVKIASEKYFIILNTAKSTKHIYYHRNLFSLFSSTTIPFKKFDPGPTRKIK